MTPELIAILGVSLALAVFGIVTLSAFRSSQD